MIPDSRHAPGKRQPSSSAPVLDPACACRSVRVPLPSRSRCSLFPGSLVRRPRALLRLSCALIQGPRRPTKRHRGRLKAPKQHHARHAAAATDPDCLRIAKPSEGSSPSPRRPLLLWSDQTRGTAARCSPTTATAPVSTRRAGRPAGRAAVPGAARRSAPSAFSKRRSTPFRPTPGAAPLHVPVPAEIAHHLRGSESMPSSCAASTSRSPSRLLVLFRSWRPRRRPPASADFVDGPRPGPGIFRPTATAPTHVLTSARSAAFFDPELERFSRTRRARAETGRGAPATATRRSRHHPPAGAASGR